MLQRVFYTTFIILASVCFSTAQIVPAAERTTEYRELLKGKSVGLIVNPSSLIGGIHLVDTLPKLGIAVEKIFAPEHGFRGKADAGAHIKDGKDAKSGLPILSLHGRNKKPNPEQLKGIDVLVFDIQDVGIRFFTYINTMFYAMEAAAENNIEVIVLDRPNPNGMYVDGPILQLEQRSFIGIQPIPIVHGLTVGELAKMINSEGWLKNKVKCKLTVIPCDQYTHAMNYSLPVKPSPNLPNDQSIKLYASLCLFEGTAISIGRGTDFPFQVYGHPKLKGDFKFTPKSKEGAHKPKLENQECHGVDLQQSGKRAFELKYILDAYHQYPDKDNFFNKNNFFNLLAGNTTLMKQIKEGKTEEEIRASWEPALGNYKTLRKKYLLYPEK